MNTTEIVKFPMAGFSTVGIEEAFEHERLHREMLASIRTHLKGDVIVASWDCVRGLTVEGEDLSTLPRQDKDRIKTWYAQMAARPVDAFKWAEGETNEKDQTTGEVKIDQKRKAARVIILAYNLNWFFESKTLVQQIALQAKAWSSSKKHLMVISTDIKRPPILEKIMTLVSYSLPDKATLTAMFTRFLATRKGCPTPEECAEASISLGEEEAESAAAHSMVMNKGKVLLTDLRNAKEQALKSVGSLTLESYGDVRLSDIKGNERMIEFTTRLLTSPKMAARRKGVFTVGVAGTGKSQTAKAIGNLAGLPVLRWDLASVQGGVVGESQGNMRKVFQLLKAFAGTNGSAGCIVFLDEMDKMFTSADRGASDGGNMRQLLGMLLSFMQDFAGKIFWLGTANDVSALPPALLRSGRWNGLYFFDLPGKRTRDACLKHFAGKFGVDLNQPVPNLEGWTGAEIEELCSQAGGMDLTLMEAAENITPISKVSKEDVDYIRKWSVTHGAKPSEDPEALPEMAAPTTTQSRDIVTAE